MQNKKLTSLQAEMKALGINAIIIPTTDPHKSEYITDYWKCQKWLTGFTGSAGTAIVTQNHAGLWTDSRYFIQAKMELNNPFVLHKLETKQPEYIDWLRKNMNYDQKLGYNSNLLSVNEVELIKKKLSVKQIKLIDVGDIFEKVWINRPDRPTNSIIEHELKYAGLTRIEKIEQLREQLKIIGASNLILSQLDDIAWLLNIRGSDIQYNPVVRSYFLLKEKQDYLFIDKFKIPESVLQSLNNDGINVLEYNEASSELSKVKNYSRIVVEKSILNQYLFNSIPDGCETVDSPDIIAHQKAIKNETEIKNYRETQIRDNIALCEFFQWLEENYVNEEITELSVAERLTQFRSKQKNYIGLSFGTISAFGANAALPHYSATEETNAVITDENLYLVDSGAQYLDGTTDITRTICLGEPTKQQKEDFTLVLKGHISLASAIFPSGTKGYQLDTLTRTALWLKGKNYGHGAGHGIGYFLNVHEGPQGFSTDANGPAKNSLLPGMLTTNEPGLYIEGEYGIRIENILLCVPYTSNNFGEFLKFETLSFCPIDTKLIDKELLTMDEVKWLNNYHLETYQKLEPYANDELKNWLKIKTKSI